MLKGRAVAIVINDNNILVIKRTKNDEHYFTLPGGGIEPGETSAEATLRELSEETTIKTKLVKQIYRHDYDNGNYQDYFLCEYISGTPQLAKNSEENLKNNRQDYYEPLWLPISRLVNTLLYPLEIRDWIISDVPKGFSDSLKTATLRVSKLRQQL